MGKYKDKLIDEVEWIENWERWANATVDGTGKTKNNDPERLTQLYGEFDSSIWQQPNYIEFPCPHEWKTVELFTSSVTECTKCGEEQ